MLNDVASNKKKLWKRCWIFPPVSVGKWRRIFTIQWGGGCWKLYWEPPTACTNFDIQCTRTIADTRRDQRD